MLFKGRRKYFIVLAVVFLFVYLFLATERIGQGVYFKPLWISSVSEDETKNSTEINSEDVKAEEEKPAVEKKIENVISAGQKALPFILGDNFGYFSEDGKILKCSTTKRRVSISKNFWTTYPEKASNTNIYAFNSTDDKALLKINAAGYVYLDEDRIYLFEPDGCAVAQYDEQSQELWRYAHSAPITAFQSSAKGSVIGYSDGKLVCIANDGSVLFEFYPGGSNYEVIMGAAISEDGTKVLCVCGIENQRVILIDIEDNHYKIVHHAFFKNDLRRQLFVDFDDEANFGIFESADGIGIIDCNSFDISFIEEKGRIIGIGNKMKNDVLTILVQRDFENTLFAISPPSSVIGKTSFMAKNTFLIQDEDRIYLGCDSKILGLKISLEVGD